MRGGYMHRLLFVNLEDGTSKVEDPGDSIYRKYLGGYGLGAGVLIGQQAAGIDPLGPQNLLGFTAGPLIGSRTINASRFTVVGKSPLTGAWGDSSCGGHFAPSLKSCGYDAVFFYGISSRPVYCRITPEAVELLDAREIWGRNTFETENWLQEKHGSGIRVCTIGMAAENGNLLGGIVHETGRMAARCGLGAVMGSKRLKALVVEGNLPTPIADIKLEKEVWQKYMGLTKDNVMVDAFRESGTTGGLKWQIEVGDTPVKNWKGSAAVDFPDPTPISGETIGRLEVKKYACHHCSLVCGAWLPYSGEDEPGLDRVRKPEYESVAAFGPLLLINDLQTIIRANEYCNLVGMDAINAGATIAFAMECYENGLITSRDTDGLELVWGNSAVLLPLLKKMAHREGIGSVLADGLARAAEQIGQGAEAFAMHIHGEAVPMHDPRFRPGWSTSYQMDATPAHHEQGGAHFGEGAWGLQGFDTPKFDKYVYSGKAEFQKQVSTLVHVTNASGVCKFLIHSLPVSFLWEFLNAVTGTAYGLEDLYDLGERISVVRQVFNVREGIKPVDMRMPDRMRGAPPLDSGPLKGIQIDDDLQIREYLERMDWDEDGRPSQKRLKELGLDDLIPVVWPADR